MKIYRIVVVDFCYIAVIHISFTATYKVSALCHHDTDCQEQPYMKCFKDYEGCNAGLCGCIERANGGRCLDPRSALEGYQCAKHNDCSRGLECLSGQCTCSGSMDPYGFCVRISDKLVGEICTVNDRCIAKRQDGVGYITDGVFCQNDVCQCVKGRTRYGHSCRRVYIGEQGCLHNTDCMGGSICITGKCQCPTNFKEMSSGKCGHKDAIDNIPERNICDETRDMDRYCKRGHRCHKCQDHSNYRCWKFSSTRLFNNSSFIHKHSKWRIIWILASFAIVSTMWLS